MKTQHVLLSLMLMAGACGGGDSAVDAGKAIDAAPLSGTFSLAWSLSDGTDAVTCADVGGLSIGISITPAGGGGGQSEAFTCAGGSGTSRPMPVGLYNLSIELKAAAGALADPVRITNVEIKQGENTALDAQTFVVAATGAFTFKVTTSSAGDNCDTGGTGAGIGGLIFELRDSTGACTPTTFDVAAGAVGAASTYTTTCPAGAQHACIEKDQVITVNGVSSGSHTLMMTGFKDAIDCYTRSPQFSVPGNNLVTDLPDQQLSLRFTPDCDPNAPDAGPTTDAGPADAGPADASM